MTLRAIIADDEPLSRDYLKAMLEEQGVVVAAEAESARQVLDLVEDLQPDILFLDIQMPRMSGLQLAALVHGLTNPPLVVFVTGYSEHAVEAFEKDALDYLLKPVSAERLAATLVKARKHLPDSAALLKARQTIQRRAQEGSRTKRLPVRGRYSIKFIRVDRILCAVAKDQRVIVTTLDGDQRTYYTLTELENLLPENRFMRVHASCIVDLDLVDELLIYGNHAYAVKLRNGLEFPVSRAAYPELQRRMGLKETSGGEAT